MSLDKNKMTVRTSCKNCSFAVYDNNTQTGCLQDRLYKFDKSIIEAYDNDKNFYIIDRFCNYYRDISWGYSQADIEKVKKESANSYLLLIDCEKISDEHEVVSLLSNMDYYKEKVSILLFHSHDNKDKLQSKVSYIAKNCNKNLGISVVFDNTNYFLHDIIMKKTISTFHCLIKSTDRKCSKSLECIENFINNDLKRAFVIKHFDNLYINNNVYKAIAHTHEFHSYTNTVEQLIKDSQDLNMYIEL